MGHQKVAVPEGMLQEAVEVARADVGYPHPDSDHNARVVGITRRTLEAALHWLDDEMDSLERKPYEDALAHQYNACLADVRRMFLAYGHQLPEPEQEDYADRILKNASPAYTPTHAELDKIWNHIFSAGHGWTPPELRKKDARSEVPEEVKDLLWSESLYSGDTEFHAAIPNVNKTILESFRRGQKAGSK